MTYPEIVSKIDTVLQYEFLVMYNTTEYKRQFVQVAREIIGIEQECRSCLEQAYDKMSKLRYKLSVLMAEGKTKDKYTLKLPKGKNSLSFGGIVLTNDNYSDEAAEKMVKLNPAYAEYFEGMAKSSQKSESSSQKKSS